MKRRIINKDNRDKAFIGAAIGAIGNIVGGVISGKKQKKAQEKAYRQAQIEQTRNEGFQQAAAMSAQYANQDYVDQYKQKITLKDGGKVNMKGKYKDRVAVAKRYKCGGRKKSNLGTEIVNDFKNIGQAFKGDNLDNTIVDGLNAIGDIINRRNNVNSTPINTFSSSANTTNYINNANNVAQQSEIRKQQKSNIARCGTKKRFACGGRKKATFGIGDAIKGVGNIVSSAIQPTNTPKQIKKSYGFSYNAPKIGIEQNSYQSDINGNPINAVNTNNVAQPQYQDRIKQAMRCGGRKRAKYGIKKK